MVISFLLINTAKMEEIIKITEKELNYFLNDYFLEQFFTYNEPDWPGIIFIDENRCIKNDSLKKISYLIQLDKTIDKYLKIFKSTPISLNDIDYIYVFDQYYINIKNLHYNQYIIADVIFASCHDNNSNIIIKNNNIYCNIIGLEVLCLIRIDRLNSKSIDKKKDIKTYVMYDEDTGYYKIGKSKNIFYRERTLSSHIPNIKTILWLDYDIEKELHNHFEIKHQRGEWFNLSADDILFLIEKHGFEKI